MGIKDRAAEQSFHELLQEKRIVVAVEVEQMKERLYCRAEDLPYIERVLQNPELRERCEFIAPLDNLMWDRKLIYALFDFDYKWEIYTPASKRKFGYYVLPLLYGDRFIGRAEMIVERKFNRLVVKHVWYENDTKVTEHMAAAIQDCFQRFSIFNHCEVVSIEG